MTKIKKAIFPAAGFGTRFLPVTKSVPKEMLPIVDKPVIQYLVEEAIASGIEEIIFVTNRSKRSIEDYFDYCFELEHTLQKKKKTKELEQIQKIHKMAKFSFVRQDRPRGDGHAILCAENLIGNEPFAVLFGDDIVDNDIPALKQLIQVYEKTNSPVIGLEKIDKELSSQYGIIKAKESQEKTHLIESLVEKPNPEDAPSDLAIIGKYVLTPDIFAALKNANPSDDGEIRLIDGFRNLIKNRSIYGQELSGQRFDTGTKIGLLAATLNYACKDENLKKDLKKIIEKI